MQKYYFPFISRKNTTNRLFLQKNLCPKKTNKGVNLPEIFLKTSPANYLDSLCFSTFNNKFSLVIKIAIHVISAMVNMYGAGSRTSGKNRGMCFDVCPSFVSPRS